MELALDTGATSALTVAAPVRTRDLRIRIGRRAAPAFFEKRVEYAGGAPLRLVARPDELEIRIVPRGQTWRMTVARIGSGEEISTFVLDDPLSSDSGGGCHLDTDYEHTGGLWIELGVTGKEWSASQACAQLRP
jgi:hypothetical protein